ncbi:major allergen Pru av 1-like [Humulus lupulus]|uniref:major allergen Pru av 1-like n=1 Tax=Humulus lupulus TaxID=3486 RepID=UPI002B4156A9|nr:major allergen Pru av 1-like [Humulus lupulus]
MGVFTHETETVSPIPPTRLFKALVLDADNLIPKVVPQAIKSVEILQGNGGPGTIKKITFGEGSSYKYVKHKVDKLDLDNFTFSYSVIEGDVLGDVIEKISYETKLVASADGTGSIAKRTSQYYTKDGHEISEESVNEGKDKASHLFKAIEAYLLSNPDAYN